MVCKIWDLLQAEYPRHTLETMVNLLGDVPWTTAVAEQLHGSAAVISRYHPEYSLSMVLSRIMALATSKLLPTLTASEKKLSALTKKLQKARRACPAKAGGRQLYFGDLCKVAADKYKVTEAA